MQSSGEKESHMRPINSQELRELQLGILDEVAAFCDENGIAYFLGYGTLLGAVRHKGYIPWDDDIDIVMMREDYERFLQQFNQNRKDQLWVYEFHTRPDFPYEYAKVSRQDTRLIERIPHPFPELGVNIDIFPLENVTDDAQEVFRLARKGRLARKIKDIKLRKIGKEMVWYKQVLFAVAQFVLLPVPMISCIRKVDELAQAHRHEKPGRYVSEMEQIVKDEPQTLERDWFLRHTELPFEGRRFKAPENYDALLTAWYGDYMTVPPVEQREHHAFDAYRLEKD